MNPAVRKEVGKEGIREAAFLECTGVFATLIMVNRHTNERFQT